MLSINTNLSSLIAQNSMSSATKLLNQAVERMTTGYKINHAKDNAANYSISTNLTTKINAYMVAEDNCAMGLDMLSTANGSLDQISDKLTRLRDLQTQASNGTYGATSLNAINAEANALVDEINRLYQTAEYNGKKLFASTDAGATPAVAAYGARAAGTNTTYTDEEVAAMKTITEAKATGSFTSGETYSINSVQELQDFRDMVNAGNSGEGATFVLAKDLDLSSISNWTSIASGLDINDNDGNFIGHESFKSIFDGNGHVISNLKINTTNTACQGLFGMIESATIKNLGLENVDIDVENDMHSVGGIVGSATDSSIENCYVTGSVSSSEYVGGIAGSLNGYSGNFINNYSTASVRGSCVGGLIGSVSPYDSGQIVISNNYATGGVSGYYYAGGLFGSVSTGYDCAVIIENSYSTGDISTDGDGGGGFAGNIWDESYTNSIKITNCYATGNAVSNNPYYNAEGFAGWDYGGGACVYTNVASVQDNINSGITVTQMTAEEIAQTYTPESMGFTEANGWKIVNGQPMFTWQPDPVVLNGSNYITLQIGINSGESSGIGFDISFALGAIDDLRMIGLDTTTDYLSTLDNMLSTVNAKQTEFGAVENRLNSALDEISIQYENLVSSRSTIRDADIAEVSSEYIRQQILQQASATLLSTANQSPSIALQLI